MTALSRLPTDTQNILALIKKPATGFDKLDIWFDDPYPELPLDELTPLCSSIKLIPALTVNFHFLRQSKLVIVAPSAKALSMLCKAVGTRYRTEVNYAELALDFPTKSAADAHTVQKYLLAHFQPDHQRFREPVKHFETTTYFNSSEQTITIYPDDAGKQTPGPCCHLEFRFRSLEEVSGLGIATVHDLPLFDHRKFWNTHLRLNDFCSLEELGRLILPDPDVKVPALYKRANRFINSHAHVLHDCLCSAPEISKILKSIDHQHFLPEPYQRKKPQPFAPVVTKTFAAPGQQRAKVKLTDEQLGVINGFVGKLFTRLVVQAVAGSGKTKTLVEIVRRLLAAGVRPSRILLISFSNRAVDTMRSRVGKGISVKTFHSFALSLIPASEKRKYLIGNKIDFPAILTRGRKMLETIDLPYDYVFVDEFQDMDQDQFHFFKAIIRQVRNYALFGDSWQSVFGFSGGGAVLDPAKELGTALKKLTVSHRLTHENAAFARALTGLKIVGVKPGPQPYFCKCETHAEMTTAITWRVKKLLADSVPPSEIVVLTRTNAQQRSIERALLELGVHVAPSYIGKDGPCYIEILLVLFEEINRRVGSKPTLDDYHEIADLLRRSASRSINDEKGARQLFWDGVRTPSFAGRYAATSRLLTRLQPDAEKLEHELNRWAAVVAGFSDITTFRAFLESLADQPPVRLSTIHDAKGDEFDHVLVTGVVEGNLPFHIGNYNEEKRLFYVAVTRARQRCYLYQGPCFHVNKHKEGRTFDEPSRFLTPEVRGTLKRNRPRMVDEIR